MPGNLKSFGPGELSAQALGKAGQQYYKWKLANSVASKDGDGDSGKASKSDWMDLVGSAGMVMGAIKKRDGEQKKMVITMQNSSPHVVVPFKVELPSDKFYAKSTLCVMTPGDSSEVEFDVNSKFSYGSVNPCSFFVHFAVVASNGKHTICTYHFNAQLGAFIPQALSGYGTVAYFPSSGRPRDDELAENFVVAAEGTDDYPSFGISMVKVVIDPENGTSKVGIVITPWNVGTVAPSADFFAFPSWNSGTVELYADRNQGAIDVGLMAWNYLKRSSDNSTSAVASGTKASVGGVASLVTMGVNLLMGARNLMRKDNGCHNLVLSIKNMTSHTVTVANVDRAEGCYAENSFIPPHGEGTVHLGTKNFAGGSSGNDNGPCVLLCVNNGVAETKLSIPFADTTHSGFSGQIRVRGVKQLNSSANDFDGYNLDCTNLFSSFYKSENENGVAEFLMMSAPVSKGEADLTLVLIN